MAHILIVEDSATAIVTLKACLNQAGHRLQSKQSVDAAWQAMQQDPLIDLLILDLALGKEDGFKLLNRIRTDLFFKKLPVLIYTINTNRDTVIKVLNCGIQNYLLKPAKPDQILDEAKKAESVAWRKSIFDTFANLSHAFGYTLLEYSVLLSDAKEAVQECEQYMRASLAEGDRRACLAHLKRLKRATQNLGCHLLDSIITDLQLLTQQQDVTTLKRHIHYLCMLAIVVDEKIAFLSEPNGEATESTATISEPNECALLDKIESLDNLPSFGNLAQSFKDATQSLDIDVNRVVKIINRDPGLALQVIGFANSAYVGSQNEIDDVEMAVQLLGFRRIQFIALSTARSQPSKHLFSAFDWRSFWTNQIGCAHVCAKVIEALNAPPLPQAYMAGVLHGIGQMIISNYYPSKYAEAVEYAKEYKLSLSDAEQEFFNISHEVIGAKYAHNHNLPKGLEMAIRYQHQPEQAGRHQALAAVLNVAIFLSNKYNLGNNGMPRISPYLVTLNKLPSWNIIKAWAQPRTAVENFEATMERHIRSIRADVEQLAEQIAYPALGV